jgi:type VI secretion system protein ImpB
MAKDDINPTVNRVNLLYKSTTGDQSESELPFKVLIMGDFTHTGEQPILNEREAIEVNSDNLDAVITTLEPKIEITVKETFKGEEGARIPIQLKINSLKDFEPQRLVENIAPLRQILDLRKSLLNARKILSNNPNLVKEIQDILDDKTKREKVQEELSKIIGKKSDI